MITKLLIILLVIPFTSASLGVSPGTVEVETCYNCQTVVDFRVYSDEQIEIMAGFLGNEVKTVIPKNRFTLISIPFQAKKSFQDVIIVETIGKQVNSAAQLELRVEVAGKASPVVGMALVFAIISIGGLIFGVKHSTNSH